jgi:hypothetical protein
MGKRVFFWMKKSKVYRRSQRERVINRLSHADERKLPAARQQMEEGGKVEFHQS